MKITPKDLHNHNKKCYYFKDLEFDDGLFDNYVDMTYVITMETSSRDFMSQLINNKPASKVRIQYNKGFKNCKKQLKKQSSNYDLGDALRNIFEDALDKGYKHILVFEDDFIIDKNKFKISDIDYIGEFIKRKNPDVYNLGTLFHVSLPNINGLHKRNFYSTSSHAVIYNQNYMKNFIKDYAKGKISQTDGKYMNKFKTYSFRYPIIFQTFPETDNMKNWVGGYKLVKKIIDHFELDKNVDNYQKVYSFCNYLPYGIIIFFIIIVIITLYFTLKKRKKN
jgi:hypothetical protein